MSKTTVQTDAATTLSAESKGGEYLAIGRVAAEVNDALRAGRQPDVEALVAENAELADQIRELVPALVMLHELGQDAMPVDATGDVDHSGSRSFTGRLGDYRIVREIGRGGMGVVYEAEQVSLGRKVALKVLPFAAVLDQRQLHRFKNEAQAAAQLHHQNIVPVYSVGCERGVHYYAMQYIEGQTLAAVIGELRHVSGLDGVEPNELPHLASEQTRSLAAGRWAPGKGSSGAGGLPTPTPVGHGSSAAMQALASEYSTKSPAFFRSVCHLGIQAAQALDHAHESGVLHRDIKPGNLLLDIDGHLWITDFGLAHMESDPGLTMTGDILGTVRYMSPEQALAKRIPIDHRTDIYSLGVTLYELLTLQPAFTGRDRQELLRQIAFDEPRRPRRLNSAIPAELETIVLKAVGKNPEERYGTAQDLADDLQRFLEDKPIKAKRPSLIDRAAKWSRRHRAIVASGIVFLIMAVAALSVSTVLIWQEQAQTAAALTDAKTERDRAETLQQRAETNLQHARDAVDQMYTDVAGQLEDQPHMEQTRRALLERALELYKRLREQEGDDPNVRSDVGRAHRRVGTINELLGQKEQAAESYRHAVGTFEKLVTEFPDQPEYRKELATTCTHLGRVLRDAGRAQDGEAPCRRAQQIWEDLVDEFPEMPEYRGHLGSTLDDLGLVLSDTDQREEAEKVYRVGLALLEELKADLANEPEYRSELARIHSNLGILLGNTGREEEQVAAYRVAIELQRKLVDDFPEKRKYQDALAFYLRNLGNVLRGPDQSQEAEELYPLALEMQEKLAADFPSVPVYWERLVDTQQSLARFFKDQKRLDEAETVYRQALDIQQERAAKNPNKPDYQWQPIYILRGLLQVLVAARKIDEATETFDKAAQAQKELIDGSPEALEYREQLAYLHFEFAYTLSNAAGRHEEAEQLYRHSLGILEDFEEQTASGAVFAHPTLAAMAHNNLGAVLADTGREEDAEAEYRRAVEVYEKLVAEFPEKPGYRDTLVRYPLRNLGMVLLRRGQFEEGEEVYRRALVLAEKLVSDDPEKADYREHLALTFRWFADGLQDAGRHAEAEAAYRQAIEIQDKLVAKYPGEPAWRQKLNNALRGMASFLVEAGKYDEATEVFQQAVRVQEELIAEHPEEPDYRERLAFTYGDFANSLRDAGRYDETEAHFQQVVEIQTALVAKAPDEPRYQQQLVSYLRTLGVDLRRGGKFQEAEEVYQRALSLQVKLVSDHPKVLEYREQLVYTHRDFADGLRDAGRRDEAEAQFQQAIEIQIALVADAPQEPRYLNDLAFTYRRLGESGFPLRRNGKTESPFQAAVEISDEILRRFNPTEQGYVWERAVNHTRLANELADKGRLQEAEQLFMQAVAEYEQVAFDAPKETWNWGESSHVYIRYGELLADTGRVTEAEAAWRKGTEVQQALVAKFPKTSAHRIELARYYGEFAKRSESVGKSDQAEELQREGLAILEKLVADSPEDLDYREQLASTHHEFANRLWDAGRYDEAEAQFQQAIEIQTALVAHAPDEPRHKEQLAATYSELATLYDAESRTDDREAALGKAIEVLPASRVMPTWIAPEAAQQRVEAFLRTAIELAANLPDEPSGLLCYTHRRLGEILKAQGRLDEAEAAYRQAIEVQEALLAEYPDRVDFIEELEEAYVLLGELLRTTDRAEQADAPLARAQALRERLPDLTRQPQEHVILYRTHVELGEILSRSGRPAQTVLRQTLALHGALRAGDPWVSRHQLGLSRLILAVKTGGEAAFRSAIDVYETLAGDFPGNSDWREWLRVSYVLLADQLGVRAGSTSSLVDRPLEYVEHAARRQIEVCEKHIEVCEKMVALFPEEAVSRRGTLITSYMALGDLLADAGRDDEVADVYGQAVGLREEWVANYPGNEGSLRELHTAYIRAASALRKIDRLENAEAFYRRAADRYEKLEAELPDDASCRAQLGDNFQGLGHAFKEIGLLREAEAAYRHAIGMREKLAADFPLVPGYRFQLASDYTGLAGFVAEAGRYDEAAEVYGKAVGVLEKLVEERPEVPVYRRHLEANTRHLGDALKAMGRVQEAERAYEQVVAIHNKLADSGVAPPSDEVSSTAHADKWWVISNFGGAGARGRMIFQGPSHSNVGRDHLMPSPNLAAVTDEVPAFDGDKVCKVQWQWVDSQARRWVRLTTNKQGNPTIDLRMPVRVRLRLDSGSLRVCLGIRETGVDVPLGEDGGTRGTIEWVGAESVIDEAPQGILVTAQPGVWQTLTFVPRPENVRPMSRVGDGVLHAANNKGVLEHLAFTIVDTPGPFTVYIDAIEQACPAPDPAGDPDGEGSDARDGGDGADRRD